MFRLGSKIFTHADAKFSLAPGEGPNADKAFRFRACKSLDLACGGKTIIVKGNDIVPEATAFGEAEPTFNLGLDYMQVSVDYLEHCGNGAIRMNHHGILLLERPGLAVVKFVIKGATIEKGFGIKSEAGGQPTDEVGGKCAEYWIETNGKVLNPFRLTPAAA